MTADTHLAAISAHRGGGEAAPEGTYEAFAAALDTGAEYIEFDIRRTADGDFVVYHDAAIRGRPLAALSYPSLCAVAGYEVPRAGEVMRLIAGSAIGHLDLKELGDEVVIIEEALEVLGPGNFVATTLEDTSVAVIKDHFPQVQVALSLGRDLADGPGPWLRRVSSRRHDIFPLNRIRACRADWAAINRRLARLGVLEQCHRHGIRTMIWTVNNARLISRYLRDPRVGVVITDRPRHAIEMRAGLLRSAQRQRCSGE